MLEVTPPAASAISNECAQRAIPETGGVRIFYRRGHCAKNQRAVRSLAVAYVANPEESDTLIQENGVRVFLADGVERMVGSRLLDAKSPSSSPPQLMLRARTDRGT